MNPNLFFVQDPSKQYLVGRIRQITRIACGKSNIVFDAKLDGVAHADVVLELNHSRLDVSRLPGSKLMVTARIEKTGDALRVTEVESFGVEYCQLAA